jgi:hypothetical protein
MVAKKVESASLNPIRLGNAVFIRTVAMYYTGRIVEILPDVLILHRLEQHSVLRIPRRIRLRANPGASH